ncbi:glycosyltransferase [Thomasclavelia cocleata]|uniref:glycosyltransferase n=1 Tax=Thomasclavelia cocleata TaxID=69824 RepID=UPI00272D94B0|nr:glycosyltransferase [Thomasclavelia cocleata]
MNNNTLISVIMPCYNDGQYLEEAVDSIINQSYINWELIIIDDGSDDVKTLEVLKSFNDKRIKVINKEHGGVVETRNIGIKNCRGKYIVPMDSDDIAHTDLLKKYIETMMNNPDVAIIYCIYEYFDMRHGVYKLPDFSIPNMLVSNCINNTSMYKKEDWEKVGGYNPNMEMGCEDYDLWLSILEKNERVICIPEVLLYYRVKNKTGRTSDIDINKEIMISNQIFENHKSLYQKYWQEFCLLSREKNIKLQKQVSDLYKEKYRIRMFIYKNQKIYKFIHKFTKRW